MLSESSVTTQPLNHSERKQLSVAWCPLHLQFLFANAPGGQVPRRLSREHPHKIIVDQLIASTIKGVRICRFTCFHGGGWVNSTPTCLVQRYHNNLSSGAFMFSGAESTNQQNKTRNGRIASASKCRSRRVFASPCTNTSQSV